MRAIRWLIPAAIACLAGAQTTTDALDAFRRGDYGSARRMFEQIATTSPNDTIARTFLALSRAATGACDAATPDLDQQFRANPDASLRRLAGIALVQCHLARNRMNDAWPVLDQLQKSFPSDADVLYETAKLHMKAWNNA